MNYLAAQVPGVLLGEVEDVDFDGKPVVRVAGKHARSAHVVWMRDAPSWRDCIGKRVVVGYTTADGETPIVLGLLDAPDSGTAAPPRKVHMKSSQELVIECGKAKIAMRADGRIEIRGGHLISRSTGPNKIKGGSVHIN
jgi:hypothetical protein